MSTSRQYVGMTIVRDVTNQRDLLLQMFEVGLTAVSAELCLPAHLPPAPEGRRLILGIGKAAAAMVRVAMRDAAPRTTAIVLTRYGHDYEYQAASADVTMFEAGHPLPDERGVDRFSVEQVKRLGPHDQLLALISGGGSALLTLPVASVTPAEKQQVTRELLLSGASISQINCVRTHLSQVKGGRLAMLAHPAKVVTLAFSDIPRRRSRPDRIGANRARPNQTRRRASGSRRLWDQRSGECGRGAR